ncbi:hypothetical protein ASG94_08810 [Nocardioides sp. Soil805]|nr:hypothetical protein ASG94_08810 [Nocardioides sp. Soil805]
MNSRKLPVVVVDDDPDVLRDDVAYLGFDYPGREVVTYQQLTSAVPALIRREEPFVLILDHDFPPEGGTTRLEGHVLATRLRERHPWGMLLPICYRSGRFSATAWTELTATEGSFAPTMYVDKASMGVVGCVEMLDSAFARTRQAWLRQAELLLEYSDYDDLEDVVPTFPPDPE